MIEIKADGPAETRLLELLHPTPSAPPAQAGSGSALVAAETQQRIENLTYIVQAQQAQLEQAQLVLSEYQQTFAALSGSQTQPLLSPAVPDGEDNDSTPPSPSRRYITGGLGQEESSRAITVGAQTAPETRPHRRRSTSLLRGWPVRLTKIGLVLTLSAATSWGVFKFVAPAVGNWLFPQTAEEPVAPPEVTESADEPAQADDPEPQSNHSGDAPGSAMNKAGTMAPALDLGGNAQ